MYKFGFIGCGNMGGTLALAVAKNEKNLAVSDANSQAAAKISEKTGAAVLGNLEIAEQCQYIVMGVKPQVLPFVLAEIAPVLSQRKDEFTLISMVAGKSIIDIEKMIGVAPIIRIMPNTPAAAGEGIILYSVGGAASPAAEAGFLQGFAAAGRIVPIAETLIDAASAISGCGPAFV